MRGAYYLMIAWVFLFGFVVMHQLKSSRRQNQNNPTQLRRDSAKSRGGEYQKMLSTFAQQNQKTWDSSLSGTPAGSDFSKSESVDNANKTIEYIKNFYKISDMSSGQESSKVIPTLTNSSTSDPIETIKSYYKVIE